MSRVINHLINKDRFMIHKVKDMYYIQSNDWEKQYKLYIEYGSVLYSYKFKTEQDCKEHIRKINQLKLTVAEKQKLEKIQEEKDTIRLIKERQELLKLRPIRKFCV